MGKAFEEIQAGLTDAIEHSAEEINVKAIRKKTGMSQQRFCAAFGISLGTLRHWEQGLRSPRGAPAQGCAKEPQGGYEGNLGVAKNINGEQNEVNYIYLNHRFIHFDIRLCIYKLFCWPAFLK